MPKRDHTPHINGDRARCACTKWQGLFRGPDEAAGVFTLRASDAHREHVERARQMVEQTELFGQQPDLFGQEAA
jgi:hypothetical protein